MKTFLFIFVLFSLKAQAFNWEAGIRETFITPEAYSYNSDSASRIKRDLFDRGYHRIALHPRIAWSGDERSIFFLPPVKSKLTDLSVMNARVSQADGKLTLRPLIFNNPGLGEAKPQDKISPRRADVAFASYGQVMAQFTRIARDSSIDRLVVGSGLVHLLRDSKNHSTFIQLLKGIRIGLTAKTELVLEVIGADDLIALAYFVSEQGQLEKLIDGISLVVDPQTHFPSGTIDFPNLKSTRLNLEALLPGMPIHLARVVTPACESPTLVASEWYCLNANDQDVKLQVSRFNELKKALLSLETQGLGFHTVEILESTTDFEPKKNDPRYPYYNSLFSDPSLYDLPPTSAKHAPAIPMPARNGLKNACIYYDKKDSPPLIDRVGDIHSVMLESVLGAFPNWNVRRQKISDYVSGDLGKCNAIFYLATNFSQEMAPTFLTEVAAFSIHSPVVWFNYKFSDLSTVLKDQGQDPGFDIPQLIQADSVPSRKNPEPGFFRFFDYKGETFFKLSQWNPVSNNFAASPEIHLISIRNKKKVNQLATARHSKTNEIIPYAVNSGNIWYLADSPFSFVHYEDRYFIFCDLLWDILGETPSKDRIALIRIEDVGPNLDMASLRWAMDYLFDEAVPFSLGVIPYYSDMINPVFKPITKYPSFMGQLKYAQKRGASFIMHGTMHSVGSLISGYDGVSGGDYEFWLYPENRPLPFDSVDWVTRRLELGISVFQEIGIKPAAFEVPHYAGSVLDYVIFSKFFRWNYHRTIYFPFEILSDTDLPDHLRSDCDPKSCGNERRAILSNLEIKADYTAFGGMTLPFITYRDAYGQSLIPETLGMIDFAFYASDTWRPVSTPSDILRRAKKLKVIRGAVASFFWHPQLLNPKSRYYQEVPGSYEEIGGKKSLSLVIDGLKELGYQFRSIDDKTLFPDERL